MGHGAWGKGHGALVRKPILNSQCPIPYSLFPTPFSKTDMKIPTDETAIANQQEVKMDAKTSEIKQIATQLLTGMLANPHIYPKVSDDMSEGTQEQDLILLAIGMAEKLIEKAENRSN